jgi:YVTN family beta-propeller protein
MRSRIALFFLALVFCFAGCQARQGMLRPASEEEGAVFVYLQSLPQDADRLSFTIDSISAIREDNTILPLSVAGTRIAGRDSRRQRLLASGLLRAGRYSGLAFRIKEARLTGEEDAALLVPEEPIRKNFAFRIDRKKSLGLFLGLKYSESLQGEVGFSPVFSVSPPPRPPAGLLGFVTNSGSDHITVFDKKKAEVVGIIPTGMRPSGMAFDQRNGKIYVAISGEDAVEVVDVLSQEVTNRIRLGIGDKPRDLAITADGRMLLVTNSGSNTVSFVDPSSLLELKRIPVGMMPGSVLLDRSGRRGYVFNMLSNSATVIDMSSKSAIATIATDPGPLRGQFSRGGDKLYLIHAQSAYLTTLNPLSFSILRRDHVGIGANAIKVDSNTDYIYIGTKGSSLIQIYDPFSLVSVDQIEAGGSAGILAIDGVENNLLVLLPEQKALRIINLVSKEISSAMDLGEDPYQVVVSGERP